MQTQSNTTHTAPTVAQSSPYIAAGAPTPKTTRIKVAKDLYCHLGPNGTLTCWEYQSNQKPEPAPARKWPAASIADLSDAKRLVAIWIKNHEPARLVELSPAVKAARDDVRRVMDRYGKDRWHGERGVMRDYLW